MESRNADQFERSSRLAAIIGRDYARDFFTLLVVYQDISASEAAARLNIHIKTAQDFLESLEAAGVLFKREAAESKRPYFRYSLKERIIHLTFDLGELYDPEVHRAAMSWKIKERKNSGVIFKEGRGERIASVHIFEGRGRSREERRFNLTESQGRFLFHLPFPTAPPSPVSTILKKAFLDDDCLPEIIDLVKLLLNHKVIEKTV